ncbi:MAG: hypothetical protein GVY22_01365 [Gammaproteobacteria bacterium]|jgi:hypothetical protein|nr:hypothetical protein [Gammaproteobacteria bacterium]
MHAEKMVVHTDAEGRLIEHPPLPPNATLEAIYLVTTDQSTTDQPQEPSERKPSSAEIARRLAADGVGTVFGDPREWQRETRQDRAPPHDRPATS